MNPAAIPFGGLLALHFLRKADARAGQNVLVFGASGAVGKNKSASDLRTCQPVLASGGACVSVDDGTPKLRRDDLILLGELAARDEIKPVIDRVYALDDIVDAHRYVDMGHKRGNVIISVAWCVLAIEAGGDDSGAGDTRLELGHNLFQVERCRLLAHRKVGE